MKLYAKNALGTSIETDVPVSNGYPENGLEQLIDNYLDWASKNRSSILKSWEEKYGSKSESN